MSTSTNPLICLCASVTRKAIVHAVKNRGAVSLQDIRRLTGANTGCRRCTERIEMIMKTEGGVEPQTKLFQ